MPRNSHQSRRDYRPLPWSDYFDEAIDVKVNDTDSFRVYLSNFSKHDEQSEHHHQDDSVSSNDGGSNIGQDAILGIKVGHTPTLILLHGGGYSGLTWSLFVSHIKDYCDCRIMAIDQRGHGCTITSNDSELSIENLVEDVARVSNKVHELYNFERMPPQVLVGHSMGGAVAVKFAARCEELMPSLIGFVVIDVVEGTAIDALQGMQSVLHSRPTKFHSLTNAIEWSVRSGMTKNCEAARVSMPGNLLNPEKRLAIYDVDKIISGELVESLDEQSNQEYYMAPNKQQLARRILKCPSLTHTKMSSSSTFSCPRNTDPLLEEGADNLDDSQSRQHFDEPDHSGDNDQFKIPSPIKDLTTGYTWRINLMNTQPYWTGWFEGLSSQLLSSPVNGKLLLLARIDRLDKELIIGQMQGKFMMRVLPKCGHAVHEDVPEQVADVIGNFLIRNKFAKAPYKEVES